MRPPHARIWERARFWGPREVAGACLAAAGLAASPARATTTVTGDFGHPHRARHPCRERIALRSHRTEARRPREPPRAAASEHVQQPGRCGLGVSAAGRRRHRRGRTRRAGRSHGDHSLRGLVSRLILVFEHDRLGKQDRDDHQPQEVRWADQHLCLRALERTEWHVERRRQHPQDRHDAEFQSILEGDVRLRAFAGFHGQDHRAFGGGYNQSYLNAFLSYCKTNNCLPDIVGWHDGDDIQADVESYRALEKTRASARYRLPSTSIAETRTSTTKGSRTFRRRSSRRFSARESRAPASPSGTRRIPVGLAASWRATRRLMEGGFSTSGTGRLRGACCPRPPLWGPARAISMARHFERGYRHGLGDCRRLERRNRPDRRERICRDAIDGERWLMP